MVPAFAEWCSAPSLAYGPHPEVPGGRTPKTRFGGFSVVVLPFLVRRRAVLASRVGGSDVYPCSSVPCCDGLTPACVSSSTHETSTHVASECCSLCSGIVALQVTEGVEKKPGVDGHV